jgi:hypothetical protein
MTTERHRVHREERLLFGAVFSAISVVSFRLNQYRGFWNHEDHKEAILLWGDFFVFFVFCVVVSFEER